MILLCKKGDAKAIVGTFWILSNNPPFADRFKEFKGSNV